ncbi:hypothetical protein NDU88_002276 [Pleurodeles waltl]|uniref:HeH/LEM domain-containing protein n=1 Tax=Pleurodeles waltl TaxID=8319 RepID=A0AAV7RBH7_PLEWA|nr:hypothetical protein NDU88_002276 [Pleurodeles waltl]
MSQSGEPSIVATNVFELEKLDTYNVSQLKQLCKEFKCPIKSSTRKVELQKVLRAWLAAKEAEEHTPEDNVAVDEEVQSIHDVLMDNEELPGGTDPRGTGGQAGKPEASTRNGEAETPA